MTDDEQLNAKFLIATSNGDVIGCGFIIDENHAMTCRHVVDTCLDRELPGGERAVWGRRLDGERFKLVPIDNTPDLGGLDVCILKLAQGHHFPAEFTVVKLERCYDGMSFTGTGAIEYVPPRNRPPDPDIQGGVLVIDLKGEVGSRPMKKKHYSITARTEDGRVDEGCSGTALFSTTGNRGMIGMVVRFQQDLSGEIIDAQTLSTCWPSLRLSNEAGAPFVEIAPKAAAGGIVLDDLEVKLPRCDRIPQTEAFRDHIDEFEERGKGALLTTIYGDLLDLPERLGLRLCQLGPERFAKARRRQPAGASSEAPGSRDVRPVKLLPRRFIDQTNCVAPTQERLRTRIAYRLQDVLHTAEPKTAAFAKAIRQLGGPLAIEVTVSEQYAVAHGAMAAQAWAALAREIAGQGLVYPMFVFFIITKADGDPEALRQWCVDGDANFVVLDELAPVTANDIKTWALNEYGENGNAIVRLVETRAGGKTIRLKQLEDLLTGN